MKAEDLSEREGGSLTEAHGASWKISVMWTTSSHTGSSSPHRIDSQADRVRFKKSTLAGDFAQPFSDIGVSVAWW